MVLRSSTTSAFRFPPPSHAPQNSHTQTPPAALSVRSCASRLFQNPPSVFRFLLIFHSEVESRAHGHGSTPFVSNSGIQRQNAESNQPWPFRDLQMVASFRRSHMH